ncbi:TPA: AAA family ATPase, partial [Campylobacter lari]|nr:AAA family ATPase [Campylobacter lari]
DNLKYNTPQSYASNHVNIEQFNDNDLLLNEELDKIKTKSKNISYEYIMKFNFNKFKQIELSIKEFNKMLKQTPENNAIERFKLDNDLEKLARLAFDIKNKLEIYKDKCPLCEQNILGIKLWEKLEKHFNEEYKQFIERLDRAKVFFENSIKELNDYTKWFNEYFIKTKLLIDDNIDQKRQEYLELIEKSVNEINKIIKCLEFKQQNPNKDNFSIEVNINLFKKILGDEIYNAIKQHNSKQQTYIKDIDENIEKVKRHFVVVEKDKILSYRNLVGIYNKIKDKIKCVSKKRKGQINDIDEKLKEMDRSFQNLNDDINDWFFKDICFEKIGDTHYKIQRLNCNDEWFECDEGLSEGEKTIVSIIYFVNHFLSKIKEIRECPIILLDDPINSLDNSNRDKIINYIYEKMLNQDRGQFFISTHIDEVCFKFDKILIDNNKKDKKTIFEIHKISKKSQVYMKEKFVLNNEFNTIYN